MNKLDPSQWRHLRLDAAGLAICAVLTAGTWFFGVAPLRAAHAWYDQQGQALDEQRKDQAHTEARLVALTQRLAQTQEALAQNRLQLQPAKQVNQRLARLTDLATRCGLRVDDIQPGAASVGARYDTVPFHLAGAGSYRACGRFMQQLQGDLVDMAVVSFDLTGGRGDPQTPLSFRFNLVWFAASTTKTASR